MPQLDFREALSTPEEKVYAVTAAVPVASPQVKDADSFLHELGLSRSTWANIVFVAIAAVGGLVCAFYFFNGGELLRAAAAWPAEFLYPRPLSADQVEVGVQPNPVDQFSKDSTSAAAGNGDAQDSANQDFRPAQLAQVAAPTDTISSAPVPPPIEGTIFPPVTTVPPVLQVPPLPPVTPPAPDSVLTDVNNIAAHPDTFGQSIYQTVTSLLPKDVTGSPVDSTVSSARKKVSSTRQKPSVRSAARPISQTTQKVTTQLQSPGIQNQTMFGGGMGAPGGIGAVASGGGVGGATAGGAGVGGVGSSGGIGGVGSVGGVGGLGSGVGGVVGGVGGVIGGIGGVHR